MSEIVPELLHFRVSHYNEKVRWALDHKRWPHRRRALVPGFHIPVVRWVSGQNQVPVLRLDGRVIAGSNHILDEIERLRPEPKLYPAQAAQRARALAIQAFFDHEVAPDLRRLFWHCYREHPDLCARVAADGFSGATRALWRASFAAMWPLMSLNMGLDADAIERARCRLPGHFAHLESEIGSSGYLVGDSFSVADLGAAAVMTALVRPPQFPYPLPEPWPPELVHLREGLSGRAGFRWVLDIYARHRDPASEIGD
jgi:glutathione S-transferase